MKRTLKKYRKNLLIKILFVFGVFFTLASTAQTETFSTQGGHTWIAPPGVIEIEVETWGGGGRGGNVNGSFLTSNNSGGGGGGAYSRSVLSVTPGQTYYIHVGNGSTTAGVAGGDSWFNGLPNTPGAPTSTPGVLAKGGNSVSGDNTTGGASGGASGQGLGDVTNSGGSGANGNGSNGGGGGSSAGTGVNGNNGSGTSGGSAPTGGGAGGNGVSQSNGNSGSTPGGGGGGSGSGFFNGTNYNGGSGAVGRVVVTVVTIDTSADVGVYTTTSSPMPQVGNTVDITFHVTNYGQTNDATNVKASAVIPDGFVVTGGSVSTGDIVDDIWEVGTLGPLATATAIIHATVSPEGPYTITATVEADESDPNPGNNTSSLTLYPVTPVANLRITKEADEYYPMVGDEVTFTLTAYNNGPDDATGVIATDLLPSGLVYDGHSGGAYNSSTGEWNIDELDSGATAELTITAIVQATGSYENEAEIEGNEFDPDENNNTSSVSVYPSFEPLELVLPCAERTYDLGDLIFPDEPPGVTISWHTDPVAASENEFTGDINEAPAGRTYYAAFYDNVKGCYSRTAEVVVKRSCLITNPMIRQRVRN